MTAVLLSPSARAFRFACLSASALLFAFFLAAASLLRHQAGTLAREATGVAIAARTAGLAEAARDADGAAERALYMGRLTAGLFVCGLGQLLLIWGAMFRPVLRRLMRENEDLAEANRLLDSRSHDLRRAQSAALNMMEDAQRSYAEAEESQEALRRSEERFRRAVEASPTAMLLVDPQGRIVLVNSEGERLFGYPRSELFGQPVEILVPAAVRGRHPIHRAGFTAHPEVRSMGIGRDLHGLRKDGREVPVEIALNPIATLEGTFVLASIVDLAAQRQRAGEEIRRYAAELERRNKELDDFVHIASHDLKEPLRGISHYSRFVLEDHGTALNEQARGQLEYLPRLCDRLGKLIDALLQFSRVGRVELDVADTDLNQVLGEVLESLDGSLRERGVDVRVPAPLPLAVCNRLLAREVFANLISNAAKYNDKAIRWVEIDAVHAPTAGGGPVLRVRDNGIGIPEKHREAIFRMFKRLHAREAFGGGMGAGLAIVKKIVERHGGDVWVESEAGQGSAFYFTFTGGVAS